MAQNQDALVEEPSTRKDELRVFVFLAVVLAPVLSIALVGGYGFFVWFTQIILGPPTG